ncbi:MAG: NIPSNAP family protein, partial [Phycisphaerae bacterium]|nr:NIPSNAP family protein [Phycisphaerae bacterium]
GKDRIFEVRVYESHNEDAARRKVHMFNNGETQLMRDVKLGPVFFGEMLIGGNVPNLTYMLSAPSMDAHKEHWKAFGGHPTWKKMRVMPLYKGTVSKIYNYFLKPLKCSQI